MRYIAAWLLTFICVMLWLRGRRKQWTTWRYIEASRVENRLPRYDALAKLGLPPIGMLIAEIAITLVWLGLTYLIWRFIGP